MKSKKIFSIISIVLVVLLGISTICFADYTPTQFETSIKTSGDGAENVKSVGGKIVGIIQVVGTIVSIAMLIVIGIKYMMGSAEERADYKKTLLPYFIGAILIFAATSLAQMVYNWASKI